MEHSTAGRVQRVATEKAPRAVKRKIVVVATEVKEKQACCEVKCCIWRLALWLVTPCNR